MCDGVQPLWVMSRIPLYKLLSKLKQIKWSHIKLLAAYFENVCVFVCVFEFEFVINSGLFMGSQKFRASMAPMRSPRQRRARISKHRNDDDERRRSDHPCEIACVIWKQSDQIVWPSVTNSVWQFAGHVRDDIRSGKRFVAAKHTRCGLQTRTPIGRSQESTSRRVVGAICC